MTAFLTSLLAGILLTGVVLWYGRRRPVDQPLTWGEAFAGATFVFGIMVLAYGVIPHLWLTWCDKELAWRADKTGIPIGPLNEAGWGVFKNGKDALGFIPVDKGVFWPEGITFFGRGRILISAEQIRDTIVSGIYIGFIAVQCILWAWWQKRGKVAKEKAEREALGTSAYGRPLTKAST